ncbi:MauE/DoxX family redox-associated membrane protein [Nocardia sp. NPDC050712]|uniref:MauE/DoxX family redox-associated membrane protein n=1 Tax=Nocardia sp. NPDC050712 TaxID=3155518 RepID=UPI0033F3C038
MPAALRQVQQAQDVSAGLCELLPGLQVRADGDVRERGHLPLLSRYQEQQRAVGVPVSAGIIELLLQIVLAVRLLVAGAAKLGDPVSLRTAVARYQVLPARLVGPVANGLPIAELAVGALLLSGRAASAAAVLYGAFAAAVAINLVRGRSFDCGCRGSQGDARISWNLFARNAICAGAAVMLAVMPTTARTAGDVVATVILAALGVCTARLLTIGWAVALRVTPASNRSI